MGDQIQNTLDSQVGFIQAELDTGLTFARVAASAKYENRRERNLANARKAYDTALDFMSRSAFPNAESAELQDKSNELKRELQRLGETF